MVLILSVPLLDKAKADWNPSEFSRIRLSTATGLDYLPSEKATSSGTNINYTIKSFGIWHTTSTLTIDDNDVKVKKSSSVLDLSVMTGVEKFTMQPWYVLLLSHKWDHTSCRLRKSRFSSKSLWFQNMNMWFFTFSLMWKIKKSFA